MCPPEKIKCRSEIHCDICRYKNNFFIKSIRRDRCPHLSANIFWVALYADPYNKRLTKSIVSLLSLCPYGTYYFFNIPARLTTNRHFRPSWQPLLHDIRLGYRERQYL